MSSVVVLSHIFCWDTKTFKIPTKVDADATDAFMGLTYNFQYPGFINKNDNDNDDQEPKESSTDTNVTDANNYAEMGFNYDSIF